MVDILEVIYGNSADSVASITIKRLVCLKIESNVDLKSAGQSIRIVYQRIDKYFGPAVLQQFLFRIKRTGIFILRPKLAKCVIRGPSIFFISTN